VTTLTRWIHNVPDLLWMTAITWLGFILRIAGLGDQSLWFDETFSWLVASQPLEKGLQIALENFVHPPLYYLLLHPVTLADQGEFALRFPSVMFGLMGIPLMYRLGRELPGDPNCTRQVGLLAAALLALNPFHVWFSRETRNYELVFLLSMLMLYAFHRLLQGRNRWAAFIAVSGLAYLTHYFTLLLALAQFVYFLLNFRRRYRLFRRWVLAQVLAFAPLSVWLVALFSQETKSMGIAWIPRPTILTPLLTLWNFALLYAERWLSWGVAALPLFVIALTFGLRPRQRRTLLVMWLVVPCLGVLLISWTLGRYFYVDRYFITSLPAFVLLVARGIASFPGRLPYRKWLIRVTAALLLVASTLSVSQILWDPALAKSDWRSVGVLLKENHHEGDRVVLRVVEDTVPLHYYAPHAEWTYVTNRPESDPWLEIERGYRRLWLVWSSPHTSNHLPVATGPFDIYTESDPATIAWLDAHQEEIVQEWNLSGLTVLLVQLTE
jgi:mannosyltransferase